MVFSSLDWCCWWRSWARPQPRALAPVAANAQGLTRRPMYGPGNL